MMTRRKGIKKRSLHRVIEHLETLFNAVSAALMDF